LEIKEKGYFDAVTQCVDSLKGCGLAAPARQEVSQQLIKSAFICTLKKI